MKNRIEGPDTTTTESPDSWPRQQVVAPPRPYEGPGTTSGTMADGTEPGMSTTVRLVLVAVIATVALVQFGLSAFYIVGALLVSIVLHEFGHYWAARRGGMKVSEFFVGFGPRLWSFQRGETEYGVKAIPAGAYVKIIGMNDLEEVDPEDEPRTYRAQGTFKRLFAVIAGPAMNLLIAFVLMVTLFLAFGRVADTWSVKGVPAGSSAAAAGVQPGDRLLAVDGEPIAEWDAFRAQLAERAGQRVTFLINRNGQQLEQPVDLGWRLDEAAAKAVPSQPAITPGDVIESADGTPLPRYDDLRALLAQPGAPVTLRVVRSNHAAKDPAAVERDPYDLKVTRPLQLPVDGAAGFFGVEPTSEMVRESPVGAVGETLRVLRDGVVATGGAFQHLFSPSGITSYAGQVADATQTTTTLAPGTVGRLTPVAGSPDPQSTANVPEDRPLSIIGIFLLGSQAAEVGLASFLSLVALVNLALAILNMLPVLPFDGGHAAIAVYEGVRGRLRGVPYRADMTKLMPFVYAVVALLVLLAGSTMLLDMLRPPSLR